MRKQNSARFSKFSAKARKYAYIQARDRNWSHEDTLHNPDCIEYMIWCCGVFQDSINEAYQSRRRPATANVSPPQPVPTDRASPEPSVFDALARLGAIRGLYVVADGAGRYKVTIKLTTGKHGNCYRYGVVDHESGIEPLLWHFALSDYWTPDRRTDS